MVIIRARLNHHKHLAHLGSKQGYGFAVASGLAIAVAMVLQQIGLEGTTTAKAGFLTALYIVFVPLFSSLMHRRPSLKTWIAVIIAVSGFYFLSLFGNDTGLVGFDVLIVGCAMAYAIQIMVIDRVGGRLDSLMFSFIQFATASLVIAIPTLIIEGIAWAWMGSLDGWMSMLYVAIVSSCGAYTLQIIGQKRARNGSIASLIMSLESVFAALSGYLFLEDVITGPQLLGMVTILFAIFIATTTLTKKPILK
jgi:drug/metabolite transporter (DMT)-like permease